MILFWMEIVSGDGEFWSRVFSFPALRRLPQPSRSPILLYAKSPLLRVALSLLELLLESRDVIGSPFGISSARINIPEPPACAVRDELRAVFLWFALVHQPTIQGCGG